MNKINFAAKRKTVDVRVDELDTTITLRALSVEHINQVKKEHDEMDTIKELALSIIDKETGERIYTTEEDVKNLSEMSITVFSQLVDALRQVNGMGKKAAEETVKN